MAGGVNHVVLLGVVSKYGVEVRFNASGTACASFMLVLSEQAQDGKIYSTLVPCEIWGRKSEAASEIEAGTLVLFEGKLKKQKKGEAWELVVSGYELTAITAPLPTSDSTPTTADAAFRYGRVG